MFAEKNVSEIFLSLRDDLAVEARIPPRLRILETWRKADRRESVAV
jgi:hypothetical protein